MKQPLIKSLIFHGVLFLIIVLSSFSFFSRKDVEPQITAITVDLKVAEKTNIPKARKNNFKKVKPAKKPKQKPVAKPKPQPPKPKPQPKVEVSEKPEKKSEKKPEKKPEPPQEDELTSLLKTLDEVEPQEQEITQNEQEYDPSEEITVSEVAAIVGKITKQIESCWVPPAGVRNAASLSVRVDVDVTRDGRMKFVGFTDQDAYYSDPVYTAAADTVRIAVLDPRCNPLKELPPLDKYEVWRELRLTFNPENLIY